jgi:hypothetical protein
LDPYSRHPNPSIHPHLPRVVRGLPTFVLNSFSLPRANLPKSSPIGSRSLESGACAPLLCTTAQAGHDASAVARPLVCAAARAGRAPPLVRPATHVICSVKTSQILSMGDGAHGGWKSSPTFSIGRSELCWLAARPPPPLPRVLPPVARAPTPRPGRPELRRPAARPPLPPPGSRDRRRHSELCRSGSGLDRDGEIEERMEREENGSHVL